MKSILIGHTGFVGGNLAAQYKYDGYFHSRNIEEIRGQKFDRVVCAGIQAKKWWANAHPEEDWDGIRRLLDILETIEAKSFVLISTVDVYPVPAGVDEDSSFQANQNHAYGKNRFAAEEFVRSQFANSLILRLPGLFGRGIKKNVIHDLMHDHELEKINPAGVYQYYALDRLQADIDKAFALGLGLLNLSAEPVSTREILGRFFPDKTVGPETAFKAAYDMRSKHWRQWNSNAEGYLYAKAEVLDQLEAFLRAGSV